jgi:glutamyl-tRNA reductase
MTIQVIGVDFQTAPLELREALAFDREEAQLFLPRLLEKTGLAEAVLLSTGNRTEVYAVPADSGEGPDPAVVVMESKGLLPDPGVWKRKQNEEAVRHLFGVAAGLRSMVKGEAQILGQVKDAFRCAVEARTTGPVLNRIFHASFRAGKRVRAETGISKGAVSVSQAAVEMTSKELLPPMEDLRFLVLGAGEMASLVVKHLASKDPRVDGLRGIRLRNIDALNGLVNGNLRRREKEAERGEAIVLEEVEDAMKWVEARKNASLIRSLAEYMEQLRAKELKNVCKAGDLSEAEKLERLSSHIIKKISAPLIKKMNAARVEGDHETLQAYLSLLEEVYRI